MTLGRSAACRSWYGFCSSVMIGRARSFCREAQRDEFADVHINISWAWGIESQFLTVLQCGIQLAGTCLCRPLLKIFCWLHRV